MVMEDKETLEQMVDLLEEDFIQMDSKIRVTQESPDLLSEAVDKEELARIMVLMQLPMEVLEEVVGVCITKIKVLEEEVDTPVEQAGMIIILALLVMHMVGAAVLTMQGLIKITNQV